MKKILLPYGKKEIPFSIPQKNLLKICWLKETPGVKDNVKAIKEAIKNPIGSPTIPIITRGKRNAVVICTDITRPTPDKLLIPPILNELNKGGISDKNIKVIIARGQHRKMTEEEVKEKVGEEVLKRVKISQHDPDNNLFYLGKSKRGNELWVNKDVAQADVKISTGNIVPHRYAGYGGGAKSILPGISSRDTIGYNHLYVETGEAALGKTKGNPVREEMEEAAKMIGLDMIVNTVMNVKNEIVKVVAGDPAMAYQAGVKACNDIYGVKIPGKADIILASSYPMDINFHQASKTLEAIGHIIKEKSTIIMLSPCYEGIGGKDFVDFLKEKTPEDIIKNIKAHPEKNVVSGIISYLITKCKEKAKIYLISEGIEDKDIIEMGMLPAKSAQSVLNDVLKDYGDEAKVLVLPTASVTLPLLEEE
ncbi:MAG: nickel-dependent lactate racemase [Candidatus Atribacteria bacterium]|nr:nickel-dependent lactate racemase [Candidatus Atribacteria bacterium]